LSTLQRISDGIEPKALDVVFVHGLAGDAFKTWRGEGDTKTFWPHWLAEEWPNIAVWSVGYSAPKHNWRLVSAERQDGMPLFDRGGQILDLLAQEGLGHRPIIFVAYSLGGLVVKQLLRRAHDAAGANESWSRIRTNTKSIVFLATPHTGSAVAVWAKLMGPIVRPSINTIELTRNDAPLRDLKNWYAHNSSDIETQAFFETRPLFGSIVVVDQVSADPSVGASAVAIDADHISIAQVASRSEHVYRSVSGAVARLIVPSPSPEAARFPWNLPTTLRPLGREQLVEALLAAMTTTSGQTLLVLGGPAIGKSTIALFAANEPGAAKRFGLRRAFLPLDQEGATSAPLIRQSIARAIGLPCEQDEWSRTSEELGMAPSLLILDNFETAWESDPRGCEALLRELATIPTLSVCVTLRGAERPTRVVWDTVFEVPKLNPMASRDLFEQVSGAQDREDPLFAALLEQMDGIPLALELLGEQRQFTPLAELAREWNQRKTSMLARPNNPVDRLGNLAVSIALSLASPRVTEAGAVLFRMLGRLPAGFSVRNLDALLGEQGFAGASALRRTRLAYDRGDRIVLLAPVREFADTLPLPPPDERKIASYFLDLLRRYAPAVGETATGVGVQMLAAETGNLEGAIRLALANGMVDEFEHLAAGLGDFQRFSGLGSPEILLDVSAAAHRAGRAGIAGRAMLRAGEIYLHRSKYEMALKAFQDASEAFAESEERISQTTCVKCGGDVLWELGRLNAAKRAYCSALRGYRRSLHRNANCATGMANCWSRLAAIAIQEKRLRIAQKAISRARLLYRDPADPLGEANCILLSGKLALLEERVADAALAFSESLTQFAAIGDREGQGEAEIGLATAAEYNQDKDGQAAHLASALDHFRAQQSPFWIGQVHYLLSQGLTGPERMERIEAARKAWDSIDRNDLTAILARE
jgi:tetratricopeptide (TPR) repeat protein/pimeloyl-ACP methyl ester carboxylesterase